MTDPRDIAIAASGVFTLEILSHGDLPRLIAAAVDGQAGAASTLAVIGAYGQRFEAALRTNSLPCDRCGSQLQRGCFSFVIALPSENPAPAAAICLALCQACAPSPAVAEQAALAALRKVWPQARKLALTHPGGGRA